MHTIFTVLSLAQRVMRSHMCVRVFVQNKAVNQGTNLLNHNHKNDRCCCRRLLISFFLPISCLLHSIGKTCKKHRERGRERRFMHEKTKKTTNKFARRKWLQLTRVMNSLCQPLLSESIHVIPQQENNYWKSTDEESSGQLVLMHPLF